MSQDSDRLSDLTERLSTVRRALLELTVVVETLAEMVAASNLATARGAGRVGWSATDVGEQH